MCDRKEAEKEGVVTPESPPRVAVAWSCCAGSVRAPVVVRWLTVAAVRMFEIARAAPASSGVRPLSMPLGE